MRFAASSNEMFHLLLFAIGSNEFVLVAHDLVSGAVTANRHSHGDCQRQGTGVAPAATPAARSPKGEGDPIPVGILSPLPVAQLSDKSRVNSSSYRNEALASHGGSQVLNVSQRDEPRPYHIQKKRRIANMCTADQSEKIKFCDTEIMRKK